MKKFLAALMIFSVPAIVFAQKEKDKAKDKKDVQQIIITRTGDKDEKTVIEIQGDKVKINGKESTTGEDVRVRVNTQVAGRSLARSPLIINRDGEHLDWDDYSASMFRVDSNRAMLGVVTEGKSNGAEIVSVTKGTAAEKAGLKKGDIITQIGNKKIESTDDVTEAVHAQKPGDKVNITFLRDGKQQKVTAELSRWKGIQWSAIATPSFDNLNDLRESFRVAPEIGRVYGPGNILFGRPRLGASVQDTDDGKGVKVLEVDDESHAEKAGLKEGDVITQVDDKAVNSAEELARLMRQKTEGSTTRLQVLRDGKSRTVEVKFPKKLKTVDL